MIPTTPKRLVERQVDTAGNRYLEPAVPLGRGGVVLEHVAHVACLPAGVADDVTGVRHLQQSQLLAVRIHRGGKAAQQAGPVAWCHVPPRLERGGGAGDGRVHLGLAERGDPGDLLSRRRIADKGGGGFVLHALIIADGARPARSVAP